MCSVCLSDNEGLIEMIYLSVLQLNILQSVSLLMEQCQALTACLDIDYWEGVTDAEREKLNLYIKVNNFDLQLSEEVAEPANSDLIETMISD